MKVKVIGGFKYKTKKGTDAWNISVVPESDNPNNIGLCTRNFTSMNEVDIKSMLDKTYLFDTSNNFVNSYYLLEEKR